MVWRIAYDLMYRFWCPWEGVGVRDSLRRLLAEGEVTPESHPRAIDIGCGSGANAVFLAEQGFDTTGVDFSPVALDAARRRAAEAGVEERCTFIEADLTERPIADVEGPFDLLIDYGALDDMRPDVRRDVARTVAGLARPGATMLFWCFQAKREDLPWFSLHQPSKLAAPLEPGEEQRMFGEFFDVEPFPLVDHPPYCACYRMTRTGG